MDDGLILNLAVDDDLSSQHSSIKKGGRWTERLKAKRVAKRKLRLGDKSSTGHRPMRDVAPRPTKKPRMETEVLHTAARVVPTSSSRPAQVISSLFSHNPKIDIPVRDLKPKPYSRPSNAPLSSFSFADLGLDPLLVSHLATKMNITKPTSIQRSALPALISTSSHNDHRDVFIQSQTGSGKTLSFLLPIIQDLLPLSSLSYIDRSIGTLAIVIAPTRELAKQISDVLEVLLHLRLRPEQESIDGQYEHSMHLTRWLVSGLLTGGATRSHEKARLRKGLPILVSTPGRLLDHLQNSSSFNVSKCRWLVLDEADRLMDLGFEETIHGIMTGLEGRRKLALTALKEGKSMEVGGWDWDRRRRTILCSATVEENVQKLAGTALINPLMVKAFGMDYLSPTDPTLADSQPPATSASEKFTPPSQLTQKYVLVPLKLRLVALVALLRSLIAQSSSQRGTKIIVFFSCTDSVDFHWKLFGGSVVDDDETSPVAKVDSERDEHEEEASGTEVRSFLLPDTCVYRLHGSLPASTRLASLRKFSATGNSKEKPASTTSAILFCTSVASRGLDLPLIRAVIQYDLPTEGGVTEYVHRIGRTARVGKGGEAWSVVASNESNWVEWIEGKMKVEEEATAGPKDRERSASLIGVDVETILQLGFGGSGNEYEERATETQLAFERWALRKKENVECARKAFLSHMRAYATHPANEKHIFHIRHLHLGHLAKSFALREAPSTVTRTDIPSASKRKNKERTNKLSRDQTQERMQATVRAQGRLSKRDGVMMNSGSSEFQITGGDALAKLVQGTR